jgi:hypothetical protein
MLSIDRKDDAALLRIHWSLLRVRDAGESGACNEQAQSALRVWIQEPSPLRGFAGFATGAATADGLVR